MSKSPSNKSPRRPAPRLEDLDGPPLLGQRYRVPVGVYRYNPAIVLPLLGALHEDIGATEGGGTRPHWQVDVRFLPPVQLQHLVELEMSFLKDDGQGQRPNLGPAQLAAHGPEVLTPLLLDTLAHAADYRVSQRVLPCLRPMPRRDLAYDVFTMEALEQHFLCVTTDGRCPHDGTPLRTLPEEDGAIVCPFDGLRWRRRPSGTFVLSPYSPDERLEARAALTAATLCLHLEHCDLTGDIEAADRGYQTASGQPLSGASLISYLVREALPTHQAQFGDTDPRLPSLIAAAVRRYRAQGAPLAAPAVAASTQTAPLRALAA